MTAISEAAWQAVPDRRPLDPPRDPTQRRAGFPIAAPARHWRLWVGTAMACFLASGALSASAFGSTASQTESALNYVAAGGEVNHVDISVASGQIRIAEADVGISITAGNGCSPTGTSNVVTCATAGITSVNVTLADGDDHLSAWSMEIPLTIDGGPGADRLGGGRASDQLTGGTGDDLFIDGCCDELPPPLDGDVFNGGEDIDTVSYSHSGGVTATIDGAPNDGRTGETDNVKTDVENLTSGSGADTLTGNSGSNALDGGSGVDLLQGGEGDDSLTTRAQDTASGGPGVDTLEDVADADGAVLNGGTGNDTLVNNAAADNTLNGDEGNDRLTTRGPGNLNGGPDDDTLVDGQNRANNILSGGAGVDTVDYRQHMGPVAVTLDGVANDGNTHPLPVPEGDNVDVENILGSSASDTLIGDVKGNRIDGAAGGDSITGGGGEDTADYSTRNEAVTVSIDASPNDGSALDGPEGSRDNVALDVEAVAGGAGGDALMGGAGPNTLSGNDGDDQLDGGSGADILHGGPGTDTAGYAGRSAAVDVSLDGVANDGETGEADNVGPNEDVEALTGGSGDDLLLGGPGANVLKGGPGADLLDGAGGPDTLSGQDGVDVADYSTRTAPVTVDLDWQTGDDGQTGEGDTADSSIEDVWGGAGADTLTGSELDNLLNGGPGADTLRGLGGADTADYSERQAGVTVTIDGAPNDGNVDDGPSGARDSVAADMEDVFGGEGNDTLVGNGAENILAGGDGSDAIAGLEGADLLLGEAGGDRLLSRDSSTDEVACGDGSDAVTADRSDEVGGDCESVSLPAINPPPVRDTTGPTLSIGLPRGQSLKRVLTRGLVVSLAARNPARATPSS